MKRSEAGKRSIGDIMIEKVLETKSGNVHYWISDQISLDSKTIFFLHGLTASHDLFVKQIDYFSKEYNYEFSNTLNTYNNTNYQEMQRIKEII